MNVERYKAFFERDKTAYKFLSSNPYKDSLFNECYSVIYDFYKKYGEDERNNGMRLNKIHIKSDELYLIGYDDNYESEMYNNTSYFFWLSAFKNDFDFEFTNIGSYHKLQPLRYGFDLFNLYIPFEEGNDKLFFVNEESCCVDFIIPIPIKVKKLIEFAYKLKI